MDETLDDDLFALPSSKFVVLQDLKIEGLTICHYPAASVRKHLSCGPPVDPQLLSPLETDYAD